MAVGDTVIPVLRPPADADNYQQGPVPVLIGKVMASGAGEATVHWSNGTTTTAHDETVLRVLTTPFTLQNVGRRARPRMSINGIDPAAVGIVVLHDAADVYIVRMPSGTMYSLTTANIEILD